MAKKSKTKDLFDIPVSIRCTICGKEAKIPYSNFSSQGGTYTCKLGGHDFILPVEAAFEALRSHGSRIDAIRRTFG